MNLLDGIPLHERTSNYAIYWHISIVDQREREFAALEIALQFDIKNAQRNCYDIINLDPEPDGLVVYPDEMETEALRLFASAMRTQMVRALTQLANSNPLYTNDRYRMPHLMRDTANRAIGVFSTLTANKVGRWANPFIYF